MKKIALLLSTYNGEAYLEELFNSLYKQSYTNFILFVRDDGSKDGSIDIIETFSSKYSNINVINQADDKNIGVIKSFCLLLETALLDQDIAYFMFVDQDDVWLPHKVEYSLSRIKELENNALTNNIPILFHTDLQVVNNELQSISKSFWEYQKINPTKKNINNLLVQNNVTGCTMIFNRSLAELTLPIPSKAIMHDWWMALVAASFGIIEWSHEVTIQYRQHGNNSVGAKKLNVNTMVKKIKEPSLVGKTISQAEAFHQQYGDRLSGKDKLIVEKYVSLANLDWIKRLKTVSKYDFNKSSFLRNLGFLYILLTQKVL